MFRSRLKEVKEENILPGRGKPWKGKGHESLQCTQGTKRNVIRSEGSEVHREEESSKGLRTFPRSPVFQAKDLVSTLQSAWETAEQ